MCKVGTLCLEVKQWLELSVHIPWGSQWYVALISFKDIPKDLFLFSRTSYIFCNEERNFLQWGKTQNERIMQKKETSFNSPSYAHSPLYIPHNVHKRGSCQNAYGIWPSSLPRIQHHTRPRFIQKLTTNQGLGLTQPKKTSLIGQGYPALYILWSPKINFRYKTEPNNLFRYTTSGPIQLFASHMPLWSLEHIILGLEFNSPCHSYMTRVNRLPC